MWHIVIPSDDIPIMIKNVFDDIYMIFKSLNIQVVISSD